MIESHPICINMFSVSLLLFLMGFCFFKFIKKAPQRGLLAMAGLCIPQGIACHIIYIINPYGINSAGELQERFYLVGGGFLLYLISLGLLTLWLALRGATRLLAAR